MADDRQKLLGKIKSLNENLWEQRVTLPRVCAWLQNFVGERAAADAEQLHALFLLTQFTYFGDMQIRECLRAIYRDLYRYPLIKDIRRKNGDALDIALIETEFKKKLKKTRFLGVGNPSESGCHLLYYFRQENNLAKDLFMNGYKVFGRDERSNSMILTSPEVSSYVFIDDFCGSGKQCVDYLSATVRSIKTLRQEARVSYFCIIGTAHGLATIRNNTNFDEVSAIFTIDESYKCFSNDSQIFITAPSWFDHQLIEEVCTHYGRQIAPGSPLGYKDGQLLLGFHHNVPDNTLPIIWRESESPAWTSIFRRYDKKYKTL